MSNALMSEYYELCNTQIIPSLADYAAGWQVLAEKFAAEGCQAMSAACAARAEFYGRQGDGEHIRIIEGSLSELLES